MDGKEDPNFKSADEHRWETPDEPQSKKQFSLATSLTVITFCALVLSIGPLVSQDFLAKTIVMLISAVVGGYFIVVVLFDLQK